MIFNNLHKTYDLNSISSYSYLHRLFTSIFTRTCYLICGSIPFVLFLHQIQATLQISWVVFLYCTFAIHSPSFWNDRNYLLDVNFEATVCMSSSRFDYNSDVLIEAVVTRDVAECVCKYKIYIQFQATAGCAKKYGLWTTNKRIYFYTFPPYFNVSHFFDRFVMMMTRQSHSTC